MRADVPLDAVTVTFGSFRRAGRRSAIAERIAEARAQGIDLAPYEDAVRALARGEDPGDVPEPPSSALEPAGWSEFRSLGHGAWSWSPLHIRYDDPDRPVVATLDVVIGDDGYPRAVRVEVHARTLDGTITASTLRIPVAEVVRVALDQVRQPGPVRPRGAHLTAPAGGGAFVFGEPTPAPPRRRGRSTEPADERLRRVADAYTNAPDGKRRAAVMAELGLASPNTTRNLIAQARKAGYLPSSTDTDTNSESEEP